MTPQRRSSVPAQPRAPNTPTSPRRASAVAPPHARSESPKTSYSSKSPAPARSKSPTLIISRHTPLKSGTPTLSQQKQQQAVPGSPAVSSSWSPASSMNGGQSSSQPVRSPSPGGPAVPGLSRLRSPSPRTTSQSTPKRPSVLRTSSSSALLKGKSPEEKTPGAPKRGQKGTFQRYSSLFIDFRNLLRYCCEGLYFISRHTLAIHSYQYYPVRYTVQFL